MAFFDIPAVSLKYGANGRAIENLCMFGGNRERTAKALGIGARTLYRKLADYDLK